MMGPILMRFLRLPSALPVTRLGPAEATGHVADLLIDTDIFIDHLHAEHQFRPKRHRVHYSVVTRAELFAGNSANDLCSQLLAPFREIDVDRGITERAGRIVRESGTRLPGCIDRGNGA